MRIIETITGKLIKVNSNQKSRTFTVITNGTKYKTNQQSKDDFTIMDRFYTGNDWENWLNNSQDFYKINKY